MRADLTRNLLNRQALQRKNKIKHHLLVLGFDEVNVLRDMDSLYEWLDRNNREKMRDLFMARYAEMMAYLSDGEKKDGEDTLDELAEMHVFGLLSDVNEVTHYSYDTELIRKRERAKEAIESVPTKAQKQLEIDKALRIFMHSTAWYVDMVSQDAELQAFRDSNVKRVERHEQMDSKTCKPCRQKNGEIYDIDDIPPLEHLNCRRWFTPAE